MKQVAAVIGSCGSASLMNKEAPSVQVSPTPKPDPRDAAAAQKLEAYAVGELGRVRKTAEHWTAGLAALFTVNSAALVIKGPESFEHLTGAPKIWVLLFIISGGICLGCGIYAAHRSSGGSPARKSGLDKLASEQQTLEGLDGKWQAAVRDLIAESRSSLRRAVQATLLAMLLLSAALTIAWMNVGDTSNGAVSTCIRTEDGVVVISGPLPEVTSGTLVVAACP